MNLTSEQIAKLSDEALNIRCQNCGSNIRKYMKEFACYLPEVEKRNFYRKKFGTVYNYARIIAGLSAATVNDILWVQHKLADKMVLKDLLAKHGWTKLKIVATIATSETQHFWAKKVEEMSRATLQTYVKEFRKQTDLMSGNGLHGQQNDSEHGEGTEDGGAEGGSAQNSSAQDNDTHPTNNSQPKQYQITIFTGIQDVSMSSSGDSTPTAVSHKSAITFKLDAETETNLRIFKQRLEKKMREPKDWNEVMKELLAAATQHENCEKKTKQVTAPDLPAMLAEIKKSLPIVSKRRIPDLVRKYLQLKYGGKCGFPGCKHPADIDHHVRRFSLIPNHDPDYIAPLCKNHERIAHHGLVQNEESPPENWKIRSNPDKSAPKFAIDLKVQKYRVPK